MAYGLVAGGGHPVVIFDPERIRARPPAPAHDIPVGGPCVISRSAPTKAVVVNGRVLIEDGEPTAAAAPWPGRLLRRLEE